MAPERTRVVNIRDLPPGPLPADHVYIGRAIPRAGLVASKWGNPFKLGQHGDRDQVIARYEAWLLENAALLAALPELRGKTLVCWCTPAACHGDVLARLADAS